MRIFSIYIIIFLVHAVSAQNMKQLENSLTPIDKIIFQKDSNAFNHIQKSGFSCGGVLDSTYYGYLNPSWDIQAKMLYTYFPTGKIKEWKSFNWTGTGWRNNSNGVFTYDSQDSLIHFYYRAWNISSPGWNTLYQEWWNFDSFGNKTSYFFNNVWQYFYTYDSNNNKTDELTQFWNGSAWQKDRWYLTHYNSSNLKTELISQFWNATVWDTNYREVYSYDAANNISMMVFQHGLSNFWQDAARYLYQHDSVNHLIEQIYQDYSGTAFTNTSRWSYTYDTVGLLRNQTQSIWQGQWDTTYHDTRLYDVLHNLLSITVDTTRQVFTYDSCNNRITAMNEILNPSSSWIKTDSTHYYYSNHIVGLNDISKQETQLNIYPNPTAGNFTISLVGFRDGNWALDVRDILGRSVIRKDVDGSLENITLQISTKGLYCVSLLNGEDRITKKVIVE